MQDKIKHAHELMCKTCNKKFFSKVYKHENKFKGNVKRAYIKAQKNYQ